MNIVDEFIKQSIINHYSIYPTRQHVLNHVLLCIGTGYEWVEVNGKFIIENRFDSPNKSSINKFEVDNPHFALDETSDAAEVANVEFQNLVRDWAARNIDTISSQHFHYYGITPRDSNPYPYCISYSLIHNHPAVDKIHPDWIEAMSRHAHDVMFHIRSQTMQRGDKEALLAWLKVERKDLYEPAFVCLQLIEDTRDEKKEKVKASIINKILAEIKAEEK